ncbi:hypothetical protein A2U01_0000302 [Trifolium medium]|uniref:Uncharacterized protein n=1 Tax=Trifolium medium TaxID=97028 RepID=A0A392LX66_9FABA|nr:hypothetical protein [Trifolium medium]
MFFSSAITLAIAGMQQDCLVWYSSDCNTIAELLFSVCSEENIKVAGRVAVHLWCLWQNRNDKVWNWNDHVLNHAVRFANNLLLCGWGGSNCCAPVDPVSAVELRQHYDDASVTHDNAHPLCFVVPLFSVFARLVQKPVK